MEEGISEEVKGISHEINRTIAEMLPDGFKHTCIMTDGENVLLATNMGAREVAKALAGLASLLADGPPGAVEIEETPGLGNMAPGGSA